MGQVMHPGSYPLTEIEELRYETIQWPAQCSRARKQRDRTTLHILVHVLQIVTQLKQHPPLERESAFFLMQPSARQAGIRQYRTTSFRAAHSQHLAVIARIAAAYLRDAFLLRSMDRQQTIEYLRVERARILFFDQRDQCP